MSIVGPSGANSLGLAGAVAGSHQKPEALKDRQQQDQAATQLRADRARLSGMDLDDAVETEFSHGQVADRDADGRLPWQPPERQPEDALPEDAPPAGNPPAAHGEAGAALDLRV